MVLYGTKVIMRRSPLIHRTTYHREFTVKNNAMGERHSAWLLLLVLVTVVRAPTGFGHGDHGTDAHGR